MCVCVCVNNICIYTFVYISIYTVFVCFTKFTVDPPVRPEPDALRDILHIDTKPPETSIQGNPSYVQSQNKTVSDLHAPASRQLVLMDFEE